MATTYSYSVIGYYEDTGQVFLDYIVSDDPYHAMAAVSKGKPETLCILGATRGSIEVITPGDDNGLAAYAVDLADLTN